MIFRIAPNPASNHLYIFQRDDGLNHDSFRLSLYSIQGQLLKTGVFLPVDGGQFIFPIDDVPSGTYILRIENPVSGYSQAEKLIIQATR